MDSLRNLHKECGQETASASDFPGKHEKSDFRLGPEFDIEAFLKTEPRATGSCSSHVYSKKEWFKYTISQIDSGDFRRAFIWGNLVGDEPFTEQDAVNVFRIGLERPEILNESRCVQPSIKLSLLSAAVLKQSLLAVRTIATYVENINASDDHGWTAMHYAAAMPDHRIFDYLRRHGGDINKPANSGLRPYDMLRFRVNHLPGQHSFSIMPFYQSGPALDRKFFKLVYQREYKPWPVITTDAWLSMRLWGSGTVNKEELADYEPLVKHLFVQLQDMSLHPNQVPRFYVTNIETADDGSELPDALASQHDLRARADIPAGTLLFLYSGDVLVPKDGPSNMAMQLSEEVCGLSLIESKDGGSFAEFINEGLPNCIQVFAVHKGIPYMFVCTLEDVKKDERLRLRYGGGHLRKHGVDAAMLDPMALRKCLEKIKDFTDPSLVRRFCNSQGEEKPTWQEVLEIARFQWKLGYLMQSTSIQYILENKLISLKDFDLLKKIWEILESNDPSGCLIQDNV